MMTALALAWPVICLPSQSPPINTVPPPVAPLVSIRVWSSRLICSPVRVMLPPLPRRESLLRLLLLKLKLPGTPGARGIGEVGVGAFGVPEDEVPLYEGALIAGLALAETSEAMAPAGTAACTLMRPPSVSPSADNLALLSVMLPAEMSSKPPVPFALETLMEPCTLASCA
jgi:hypothetical protein